MPHDDLSADDHDDPTEVVTGDLVGGPALPGLVTLSRAAEVWQVSVRTLRRRIAAGDLPGAVLRHTPTGEGWHVVPVEVDQLYPRRDDHQDHDVAGQGGPPALVGELAANLVQLVEDHRQAVAAAEEARRLAEVEAAELRTRVADLEELRKVERQALEGERNRLAAELDRARRPWWRRL